MQLKIKLVACVCPSTFIGQYCEVPVYLSCQAPVSAQCHRDYVKFYLKVLITL